MSKIYFNLPSIEDIYNEYHKQKFFMRNGVYPRTIKNFKTLYEDDRKLQHIKFFIEFLNRNRAAVDWKLYILALAKVLNQRFELKHLGTFGGNKIYRDYIKSLNLDTSNIDNIYDKIVSTLLFLNGFLKENEITFKEYFEEDSTLIPLSLKHVYAGTVSIYFYSCFPADVLARWFNYPDDVFQELFQLNKYEFLDKYFVTHRNLLLTNNKTQQLIQKLEKTFNKYF
jgi:hypothetical protein